MNRNINFLFGKVMHKRLFPKLNYFNYRIFYLSFPLSRLEELPVARNRFSMLSFYESDHGGCDGSDLTKWAKKLLAKHKIKINVGEIILIAMPRVFGYVFNPISFWLIYDRQNKLKVVLCEVRNTFKQRHIYLCAKNNVREILQGDVVVAKKLFHVSPFLKREGHYEFRFEKTKNIFSSVIVFFNGKGKKQLVTSLRGQLQKANRATVQKALWFYPFATLKAIFLIHWQACKLFIKGVRYIKKPNQLAKKSSVARSKA